MEDTDKQEEKENIDIDDNKVIFESDLKPKGIDKYFEGFEVSDYISEDQQGLMNSPFVYSEKALEKKPEQILFSNYKRVNTDTIHSIEEFGVEYKGKKLHFGSVIRNEYLTKRTKVKITKSFLRLSKKNFYKFYKDANEKIEKDIDNKNVIIKEASLVWKLIYILLFLISVFFIFIKTGLLERISGWEWTTIFLEKLNTKNKLLFSLYTYISIFSTIGVGLLFILDKILGLSYYKLRINFGRKQEKTFENINNVFEKEYKMIWKYYLTNIRKGSISYEPIGPYDLWDIDNSFFDIQISKNELDNKMIDFKKQHKIIVIISIILYILSMISNAALLEFAIFL